ncbi:uncharacterized protein LOC123295977 [Chrysoperla carnea]|uniref:uncharacterized protein LOC123295977 n=1 Tax=Chrysoperla carnea TaxID=189513 RepID=UPI001D07C28D|nr:uncharacterized protein LOC123295977 [Chrysoperla carnea]
MEHQIVLKKLNEIIFYYIHEAPRLRRLFIRWSYLELSDRKNIDEIMQKGLQEKQYQLYISLRDALEAWEHLQDTQGAPGFQSGKVQCACAKGIENDLTCVMILLENCLDKIYEQKTDQSKRPFSSITNADDVIVNHDSRILSSNELSNTTKFTFNNNYKKLTLIDSKSDSRISRGTVVTTKCSGEGGLFTKTNGDIHRNQRTRSTSANERNDCKLNDFHKLIKFSSTNGYRSE